MSTVPTAGPSTGTYTVGDVAKLLGCSTRHVRRLADAGRMPRPLATIGRLVRWRCSTGNPMTGVDDWLTAGCPSCRSAPKARAT